MADRKTVTSSARSEAALVWRTFGSFQRASARMSGRPIPAQSARNCLSLLAAIISRPSSVSNAPDDGLWLQASLPEGFGIQPPVRWLVTSEAISIIAVSSIATSRWIASPVRLVSCSADTMAKAALRPVA